MTNRRISRALLAGVALTTMTFGPAMLATGAMTLVGTSAALAQDGSGGQGKGAQNQGGQGQGNKGAQSGQDNAGGQGSGQGGPSDDSDAKGPQAGAPAATGGGKPVWAQEGIPEVELGRLSVARSPDQVLDRAFDEAVASISPDMVDFYNMSLDEAVFELSTNWDNVTLIDSPLQNLALLKDALDGTSVLTSKGVTNDVDTLMAIFLGVASDKLIDVSPETVVAVTTILGTPVTGDDAVALAKAAEEIRIAVLAGHG
ncbi:MAG TPA: hypothetical protein VIL84_06290 [Devosiaceae bacterium]